MSHKTQPASGCLCVCLPACSSTCLSACFPLCVSVCLPAFCLSVCLSACLPACSPACLPACLPNNFMHLVIIRCCRGGGGVHERAQLGWHSPGQQRIRLECGCQRCAAVHVRVCPAAWHEVRPPQRESDTNNWFNVRKYSICSPIWLDWAYLLGTISWAPG